ncbi:MAG: KTSC domain-containing protein [Panacibacter sp.]
MKMILLLFLFGISFISNSQTCSDLPTSFKSYNEAIKKIENANFKISESVNTSKSSWIRSSRYYSCEGKFGYLVFTTDTHKYVHKNVPIEIWNQFKVASSLGSYYNAYIKYKYQLIPE